MSPLLRVFLRPRPARRALTVAAGAAAGLPLSLLAGCGTVVMNPSGDIAAQQSHLIIVSTVLMLLIIVPVIALTLLFAWRYRSTNKDAPYHPDWDHSTALELVIWSAPLLIIIALGAVTWISTHTLDPYRALRRVDADHKVSPGSAPLVVQVVALDWKWLFIYPGLGIATVNELAAPIDVPIQFKITASSVMNSFYIPALGRPDLRDAEHGDPAAGGDQPAGRIRRFLGQLQRRRLLPTCASSFHGLSQADFEKWVQKAKTNGTMLNRDAYLQLEKPSKRDPVKVFSGFDADLYDRIVNRCVAPGAACTTHMMAMDK